MWSPVCDTFNDNPSDLKNYIVDFCYPCVYSFQVKAADPYAAIRLAQNANSQNVDCYSDETVQERPGSREIDFETPPETLIYASERDYCTRPMPGVTPNKEMLDNTIKRIVGYAQAMYDTYGQLQFLIGELDIDAELLKYYGYTQDEIDEYLNDKDEDELHHGRR